MPHFFLTELRGRRTIFSRCYGIGWLLACCFLLSCAGTTTPMRAPSPPTRCLTYEEARQTTPVQVMFVPDAMLKNSVPRHEHWAFLRLTYFENKYDPVAAARSREHFTANLALFHWVQQCRHPALDYLFAYLLWLGKGWILVPIALILFVYRRRQFGPFLAVIAVETLLVQVLKTIFQEPRPAIVLPTIAPLEHVYRGSLPSGDVAMACAIAVGLYPIVPRWGRLGLIVYAAIIAFERLYVGAHFPLDVLVGAVIGVGSGFLVSGVQHYIAKTQQRKTATA